MPEKSSGTATIAKLALAATVLTALLASFGVRFWRFGGAAPLPALLQGLTDAHDAASQKAFVERLRKRFPLGSSEAELMRELRDEGFLPKKDGRPSPREASYDRAAGLQDICRRGGIVRWSADEAGKLTDISGGFYVYCP
jgi:hypothetical protein